MCTCAGRQYASEGTSASKAQLSLSEPVCHPIYFTPIEQFSEASTSRHMPSLGDAFAHLHYQHLISFTPLNFLDATSSLPPTFTNLPPPPQVSSLTLYLPLLVTLLPLSLHLRITPILVKPT